MIESKRAVSTVFVAALFLYFCSESILRQAILSKLTTQKFNIDTVLSKLPAAFRNSAKKSYETAQLKDAVLGARTDAEKVTALTNLAMAIENKKEKENLYFEILKYPPRCESVHAFAYFLLNPGSAHPVSIGEYHDFIRECPDIHKVDIWKAGALQLQAKKFSLEKQLEYLKPLLDIEPPYREYQGLYENISDISFGINDEESLEKSGVLQEKCLNLPSVEEELRKLAKGKIKK